MDSVGLQILILIVVFLLGMLTYGYSVKNRLQQSKNAVQAVFIDALTGMGNRYKFNKVIEEMTKHKETKFALCFLDLDDFKHINDNMGHDAGDELLIELGKRLNESLEDHGEVFRLGGDEYALIITGIDSRLEVETIIKRVQRNVVKPVDIRGNKINLEYSLGVAMFPEDSTDSVQLVNYADTAMYHIKESGKSDYYFHNDAIKAQAEDRRRMESELKHAFENKEFDIDYQPRVNLKDSKDIWLETFLYWNHSSFGKLRAEYFLKIAETMGLIIQIDEYVVAKAIQKVNELNKKGFKVNVAMNISLRHFQRKDFTDRLCEILERNPFEPGSIMFQITDTIDVNKIEDYKVMFEKIKNQGVKISVSNFEIKYEVMNMFRRLEIDEVKISSDYIQANSIFKTIIFENIITLSKNLGYQIVVVRVEDEKTLNKVIKYDIDMIQGNHLYDILTEEQLLSFLEEFQKSKKGSKIKKKQDISEK